MSALQPTPEPVTHEMVPTRTGPVRVAWEGDFLGLHSLALVNRALCRELLERGHDVRPIQDPAGPAVGAAQAPPLDPRLAARLGQAAEGERAQVEGRGTSDGLAGVPINLSRLTNLNRMANTPDPRDFHRLSRVVLMPSLWRESLGRVAVEAMANGIPVIASDCGATPETLGDAGFVLTIPGRYGSSSLAVPSPREVAPWVAIVEWLWDDPEFAARHQALALAEARRWDADRLVERYEALFRSM